MAGILGNVNTIRNSQLNMANPNPERSKEFKSREFKAIAGEPLAKNPICIKLPMEVDEYLRSLPQDVRVKLVRDAICNAVKASCTELQKH
jgi:hypothetical protein